MAVLYRAVATLRIVGEDLDPEDITTKLGHAPTRSRRKEDATQAQREANTLAARHSSWSFEATPTEPENLAAQVKEIVTALTPDLSIWRDLSSRYRVDLFCGWFMSESNEGVDIPVETLKALASRGIVLALDIYAPDRN